MTKGNLLAIVLAVVIVAGAVTGTVFLVKGRNKAPETTETETETETVETTEETPAYLVDLLYIERMLKENRFTDEFEEYTKDSFPISNDSSKEAYWHGIQQGTVVNPLLLAATSETLHALGFNTQDVKPSELYYTSGNGEGVLNEKGEQTLEAVRVIIFSDQTKVYTADLGANASQYYNSSPSKDDGIVYGQRVGISGNTACWVISVTKEVDTTTTPDIDSSYDNILNGETTTASSSTEPKTVIQLCRCGNTATKTPPKTPTTTRPATTRSTTTQQPTTTATTTKPSTTKPTTTVPSTTKPTTTKPSTTKPSTTKNPAQDPVNQSNAPRGGGKNDPTEKATSTYQPEKPTKATTVRTVESTTKPTTTTTTKPSTTKPTTTKPSTTNPTTTAPTAKPTEKPSSSYSDGTTTTVISPSDIFTGDPQLPD